MGYTHYWRRPSIISDLKLAKCLTDMDRIVATARKLGRALDVTREKAEIMINGVGDDSHETFCFPGAPGFDFCKTARKPYDDVVTACLLAVRKHFGPLIEVSSDGSAEEWKPGAALYELALERKPPSLAFLKE